MIHNYDILCYIPEKQAVPVGYADTSFKNNKNNIPKST